MRIRKKQQTYYLLSLGCSKNTVDSESIARLLEGDGYHGTADADGASVLIVNTCGFIGTARQESIDALRELAAAKRPDQLLIAAGCLSQRYGAALAQEISGLDGVIGTRRWMDILELISRLRDRKHPEPLYHLPDEASTVGRDERGVLRVSVQGSSAYLKIADGCRRPCSFCAIPAIKGKHVSREPEAILKEAALLNEMGLREIILISQDTTDYGHDIGRRNGLAPLLREMVRVAPDVDWIRIMYAYPGYVTDELIDAMASEPKILPYLDMPLQHGHPEVLRRMKRPAKVEWVYETIEKMRAAMPGLAIRTTFIVGYPGETDEEFETLLNFVRDLRFDRVGAFTYSFEIGTPSALLPGQVPDEIKLARLDALMTLQQDISHQINQGFVGKTLHVLVEGQGDGLSVGRSYRDAPEIDGMVIVEGDLPVGEIVPVQISGAMAYDLIGTVQTHPASLIMPNSISFSGSDSQ